MGYLCNVDRDGIRIFVKDQKHISIPSLFWGDTVRLVIEPLRGNTNEGKMRIYNPAEAIRSLISAWNKLRMHNGIALPFVYGLTTAN